jgi:hypothetical protein
VFNAYYLCFVQNLCRRISISKFQLENLIIDIFQSNYINFQEIMRSYEAINNENLKQLV